MPNAQKTANGGFVAKTSKSCLTSKQKQGVTTPFLEEVGSHVRAQMLAQLDEPNPIGFTLPDGTKGRVWLASDERGNKIIGDDRHWRVHIADCPRGRPWRAPVASSWSPTAQELNRPLINAGEENTDAVQKIEGSAHIPLHRLVPDPPARDPACVQQNIWPWPWGFKIRLCIENEKELQVLGCGWKIVTVEFDGPNVHLHHQGNTATMKRQAFKELVAASKRCRDRNGKHDGAGMMTPEQTVRTVPTLLQHKLEAWMPDYQHALQGDDYNLDYHEDGYPRLPACLRRRAPIRLVVSNRAPDAPQAGETEGEAGAAAA